MSETKEHYDPDEGDTVVYTRTHYGRGTPLSYEESVTRLTTAWYIARDLWKPRPDYPIYMATDEDVYFTPDPNDPGMMGPVTNLDEALSTWWNLYASCEPEKDLIERGFEPMIRHYGRGMIEEEDK